MPPRPLGRCGAAWRCTGSAAAASGAAGTPPSREGHLHLVRDCLPHDRVHMLNPMFRLATSMLVEPEHRRLPRHPYGNPASTWHAGQQLAGLPVGEPELAHEAAPQHRHRPQVAKAQHVQRQPGQQRLGGGAARKGRAAPGRLLPCGCMVRGWGGRRHGSTQGCVLAGRHGCRGGS